MTTEKYIFRSEAKKEFTLIRNKLITDKSLSWEARGLVIYLLSKPETWIVMKRDLVEASPAAGKKTSSILKELETSGYIKRNKFRNKKGQWEWHTWVYDIPQPLPILPKRGDGETILPKTTHGEPIPGNGANIVSTELKKTEPEKKEKELKTDDDDAGKVFTMFENNIQLLTPILADNIKAELEEVPSSEWITDAITIAVENNARNWNYIQSILDSWKKHGKGNKKYRENYGKSKTKKNKPSNSKPAKMHMSDEEAVRRLKAQGRL